MSFLPLGVKKRASERASETERDRERQRQRETEKDRDRERQIDRQTDTERQTDEAEKRTDIVRLPACRLAARQDRLAGYKARLQCNFKETCLQTDIMRSGSLTAT